MITDVALGALALAAAAAGWRLFLGPTLADRVLGLDVVLVSLMGGIAVRAVDTGDLSLLGLLPAVAIVAFTASVAASHFIEKEQAS